MKSVKTAFVAAQLSLLAAMMLAAQSARAQQAASGQAMPAAASQAMPAAASQAMPAAASPAMPALHSARYLAATCANCHGTDGRAVPGSGALALAGMPRQDFLAAIAAFRTGARPSMIMHQLVRGYTDDQMAMLADHFARQPK